MNCGIHETNERDIIHEPATSLIGVPDYILDEWAAAYQFDQVQEAIETNLRTYCILERNTPITNLIKIEEDLDRL